VKLISTKLEIISTQTNWQPKNCASQVKLQLLFISWHRCFFRVANFDLPVDSNEALKPSVLRQSFWLVLTDLCQHLHLDTTMEKSISGHQVEKMRKILNKKKCIPKTKKQRHTILQ